MLHQNTTLEHISTIIPRVLDSCLHSPGVFLGEVTGARIPARCRQWKCQQCGPRLARRFIVRARKAGPYNLMVTFTTGEQPTAESIKLLNARAREFRRLFQKYVAPIYGWTWVNETGPRGQHVVHKHLLLATDNKWLDWRGGATRDLNSNLHHLVDRAGFAGLWRHFDVIKGDGDVAGYVSKYLAKELKVEYPRYARRCMTTAPAPVFPCFEPLQFRSIEVCKANGEVREVADMQTGEVGYLYCGPSYVAPVAEPLWPGLFFVLTILDSKRDSVEVQEKVL